MKDSEIAKAQEAYGKWNTAPAWNRTGQKCGGDLVFLVVGWILTALPFILFLF